MPVDQTHRSASSADSVAPLRVGDVVRVAGPEQILRTLDAEGRCDGLPFMPQMIAYCGQQLRVTRWVNNVCVQEPPGMYFGNLANAVLLDTQRCDGIAQGGCQFACPLMWRTEWLTPVSDQGREEELAVGSEAYAALVERATQAVDAGSDSNSVSSQSSSATGCVSCQSTELYKIAPPRSKSDFAQYSDEKNLNRVSAVSIATAFCGGMLARVRGQHNGFVGTLAKTPQHDLNLQLGDQVRVRTRDEIIATLDRKGKNRGLWFDPVMLRYCGQELKVTKRVTRIVDERSGRLLKLKTPSIVLDDLHCQPSDRRFCSRLLHLFWREIWLQRL